MFSLLRQFQSLNADCTPVDGDHQLPLITAGINVGDVTMVVPPMVVPLVGTQRCHTHTYLQVWGLVGTQSSHTHAHAAGIVKRRVVWRSAWHRVQTCTDTSLHTSRIPRPDALDSLSLQGVDTCLNSGAEVRVCVFNLRTSGLSNAVLLRMPRFSNPSLPNTEHFVSVFSSTSTTRPPTNSLSLWGNIARVCCLLSPKCSAHLAGLGWQVNADISMRFR